MRSGCGPETLPHPHQRSSSGSGASLQDRGHASVEHLAVSKTWLLQLGELAVPRTWLRELGSWLGEMAQVISATEVLNCGAVDAWECCKHSDKVLPDLVPEYFSRAEVLEGSGGPGTLRILHFGPGMVG